MTTQEAFERQIEWFSRPGAKLGVTLNADGQPQGGCAYRGGVMREMGEEFHSVGFAGSERRCVVGCLIPDEAYAEHPKEGSIGIIFHEIEMGEVEPELLSAWGLDGIDRGWLEKTQAIHDQLATCNLKADLSNEDELVKHLVAVLKQAGEEWGLKVPQSA